MQNADNESALHLAAAGDCNEIIHCIINCVLFKTSDAKKQASRERLLTALAVYVARWALYLRCSCAKSSATVTEC